MSDTVLLPGARDVRASLDTPNSRSCVVACPPHPQMGGSRSDRRLRAVSAHLAPAVACLRFDFGAWDTGHGEIADCQHALAWARNRFHTVAVFGYSFGAGVALAAAARESTDGTPPKAVSVLAPPDRIDDINAGAAVSTIDCNLQVLYGERDTTVDSTAVITQAREQGADVTALAADHHFVGQDTTVGATVAEFLFAQLS